MNALSSPPTSMPTTEERIRAIPLWRAPIKWESLKGGLSNESYVVCQGEERFVVRFSFDFPFHHVSRKRELASAHAAYLAGFGPKILHAERGLTVSQFIDAQTFDAAAVRANIKRIAHRLRDFHNTMPRHIIGEAGFFWVFHIIREYARALQKNAGQDAKHSVHSVANEKFVAKLPQYLALAQELEAVQTPLPIVYGHHDFLPANLMDDGDKLWIIDYEYAAFSTPMFDLANLASNAAFHHEQSCELLTEYFGTPPARALLQSHLAMQCASLLREAMWSLVSELHLNTTGVDYAAYAKENLQRLDEVVELYRSGYEKA